LPIVNSVVVICVEEITNTSPVFAEMEKFPFKSAEVPASFPLIFTVAKGTGSPPTSTTLPVTVRVCASANMQ
jgi:hypothetical protein